jgi:hypothetical protein
MFEAMGVEDVDRLHAVCVSSRNYFFDTLPSGDFRFWIAESGGEPIGTVGMVVHAIPPGADDLQGREAYLINLVVLAGHRPTWWVRRSCNTASTRQGATDSRSRARMCLM